MALLTGYLVGNPARPEEAGGDFVVGDPHPTEGWALSSVSSAFPCYYTVGRSGELLQGPNVFELCAAAQLDWHWNLTAIRHIATLGHTLGQHTLHPRIFRVPPHSRLTFMNGEARLESLDPLSKWTWEVAETAPDFPALTDAFVGCLEGAREPILSLSAGFDSRVLLALCRRNGCSPSLVTMGPAGAVDAKVAAILAHRVGLRIERVALTGSDYIEYGEEISRATSGVKTAGDWQTWLYNKQLGASGRIHLVGANGEFARTFYSDAVTRTKLFRGSGQRGAAAYFVLRALYRSRKYPRSTPFRSPVGTAKAVVSSVKMTDREYPKAALPCLDTFYATERVHHFIGSGLACYQQFSKPRSPFLDKAWMKSIALLPRRWKEGNRYLAVLEKLAPDLLEVPFNRDPDGGVQG